MSPQEFREAPPFARHVAIATWFVMNPAPERPEHEDRMRAAYNRRQGPPIRDELLPLFADGQRLTRNECRKRFPGVNNNTIGTALRRMVEEGILNGGGHAGFWKGPRYPG